MPVSELADATCSQCVTLQILDTSTPPLGKAAGCPCAVGSAVSVLRGLAGLSMLCWMPTICLSATVPAASACRTPFVVHRDTASAVAAAASRPCTACSTNPRNLTVTVAVPQPAGLPRQQSWLQVWQAEQQGTSRASATRQLQDNQDKVRQLHQVSSLSIPHAQAAQCIWQSIDFNCSPLQMPQQRHY
jgi:hypothetical protein